MENKEKISNVENVVIIGSGPAGYTAAKIIAAPIRSHFPKMAVLLSILQGYFP